MRDSQAMFLGGTAWIIAAQFSSVNFVLMNILGIFLMIISMLAKFSEPK